MLLRALRKDEGGGTRAGGIFIAGYLEGGRNGGRRRHHIAHQNVGIVG